MTDHEINIAIAEACGWSLKRKKFDNDKGAKTKHSFGYRYELAKGIAASCGTSMHGWGWMSSPVAAASKLSDYCHDLNAMHEAQSALEPGLRAQFQHHLDKICATSKDPHCSCWDFIHATARQRAEGFLRCIGKWRDA